jgi:hypothetical protein
MNIHFTATNDSGAQLTFFNGLISTTAPVLLGKDQALDLVSVLLQFVTQNWPGEKRE